MTLKIRGTFTVMVTAFDTEGRLDLDAQSRFTDWQVGQGIHGLIPLGSTGEFLSLSFSERKALTDCVINTVDGRVPVIIGAGAESTEEVIKNLEMAEESGADGTMIIPPFYSTPTRAELIKHFERISHKASKPIMLYNNPATSNVDLTPDIVAELSHLQHVDFIKESTMDVTRVRDILELSEGRMNVFGGIMGYESILSGACGWVAVGSNIMPREFSLLFSCAEGDKKLDEARKVYKNILPIVRLVSGHRYVSATKAALIEIGQPVGLPRSPRLPLPSNEFGMLQDALEQSGLLKKL
ncbi:MAG: dihydrodipicolinate synthase family protein [Paracoccaceae bacterium]|nr:dihydrodipicolinate synthase family protein [Paracoccaceae bacterium]